MQGHKFTICGTFELNIHTEALPAETVPFSLKTGGNVPSFSSVVSLGCSSHANISLPFLVFTSKGANSASKYPFLLAANMWH